MELLEDLYGLCHNKKQRIKITTMWLNDMTESLNEINENKDKYHPMQYKVYKESYESGIESLKYELDKLKG